MLGAERGLRALERSPIWLRNENDIVDEGHVNSMVRDAVAAGIALMAASLTCCGVEKCGSPAPKSTTSMPCWRSLSASATTAMVAEGSMRLIRSVSLTVGVASVTGVMLVFLFLIFLRFAA